MSKDDKVETGMDIVKKMGVNGYVGFSVKAPDTAHNRTVVSAFLDMAKTECSDNYLLAIKKLLECYAADYQYELLYDKVVELESKLEEAKSCVKCEDKSEQEDDEEDEKVF